MLILPGSMHTQGPKDPILSLPGLLAYYDSVFSNPVILPDGRVEKLHDLSGKGHDLRVRTEAARLHPTYDPGVFGALPGIGNSLVNQKVELRSDKDLRGFLPEQQTWFLVYKAYANTSLRILSLGSNYHNPVDHPNGLAWGRDENNNFPRTDIPLLPGAVCSFIFYNRGELVIRGNGRQARNSLGEPYNINPNDGYFGAGSVARYVYLFTGFDLNAPRGAFGAVAFCMQTLPLATIEKVERYLSKRFNIPLVE